MKSKLNKTIDNELNVNDKKIIDNVTNNVNWQQIKESNKKSYKHFFKIFTPIALVLIICLSIFIPSIIPAKLDSYNITLSINPKVSIVIDKNDIVTSFVPLNEDGVKLLLKENLVGLTLENATKKVLQLAVKYGYMDSTKEIKIYTTGTSNQYNKHGQDKVKSIVDKIVLENNISIGGIASLSKKEFDAIYKYFSKFDDKKYQQEVNQKLFNNIKTTVDFKILDTANLITKLLPYDIDDEQVIENFPFEKEIKDYYKKYKMKLEIELTKLTYKDVSELISDLKETEEDLKEIKDDLNEVGDEDDFDALEELIELAKELLFEDDD